MTGKPGRSGRDPSENPKGRQVAFRLDDDMSGVFDAAVAEAAREVPPGVKFTASDYLRGLFLRDAKTRGLLEPRKGKAKR